MIGLLKIFTVVLYLYNSIPLSYQNIVFPSPPLINLTYSETIVTVGRNLTLICSGKEPITWIYPENMESESAEESLKLASVTNIPDSDYPYGLMLEIIGILPTDVGYYTCAYNTSENLEEEREDLEKEGKAKSVYVFVDDPKTLMVPAYIIVNGKQYHNITFPCRPTAPNIDVSLYIKEGETSTKVIVDKEIDKLSGRKVSYDRRIGFTLPEVEMSDATYTYYCTYERDGIIQDTSTMISITPYTSSVTKPMIVEHYNGNAVIGGELHLVCNVRIDPGIQFELKWQLPNKDTHERLNISETVLVPLIGRGNIQQKQGISTLTLTGITKEDEGSYKCRIIDANGNTNFDEKKITVRMLNESFINLTENAKIYKLKLPVGKFAKWVIQIKAFPSPNITWYDNRGNKIIAPWTDNHSAKIEVKTALVNPKETWIYIKDLVLSDSGTYTVVASNEYGLTKSLNLTLTVTAASKPYLYSDTYYMANTSATMYCKIEGQPVSRVSWYFQDCLKKEECTGHYKQEMKKDMYTVSSLNDYTVESYLTIPVNRSGHVTCVGVNSIGRNLSTEAFYVSEVNEGFGIISSENVIAVGDNVTLVCVASVYKNVKGSLEWYLNNETLITNDNNEGYLLIPETTTYSYKLYLMIPSASKQHSANYTCKADAKDSEPLEKEIEIDVNDIIFPKIVKSNLNNSYLHLPLGIPNQHFDCFVEGIPIPDIQWYKDDELLETTTKDGRRYIVSLGENGRQLKFKYITKEDHGEYKCKATSRVGSANRFVNIKVDKEEFKAVYIASIAALAIIFIILISYLIWRIKKEKQIRKELSLAGLLNFKEGDMQCMNPELGVDEQADLLPYDKIWEFPRDKLKLGAQLGSGAFGVVMKAKALNIVDDEESTIVAVKMVKKTADAAFIKALASELKIMVHLGKHLNVVNLLGACTNNVAKRELLVIVEYCRFGNIHNYLLRHRGNFIDQIVRGTDTIDVNIGSDYVNRAFSISSNRSGTGKDEAGDSALGSGGLNSPNMDTNNTVISLVPGTGDADGNVTSNGSVQPEWRSNYRGDYNYNRDVKPITTQDLICWSFQVARGMEYLANRKVLHGDLAARNILLADDNIVKICDFGLAKNMYKSDNYKKKGDGPLPVKWMAIESIRDRVFSTQSDVWSYGIVLWEMFSLAKTPYPGMEADEKFYNRLVKGYRMEKPEFANKQIYQTMLQCWRAQPIQRPTFSELADRLGNLLEDGVRNHYIDLNNPYIDMNNKWMAERGDNDFLAMMSAPDYGNLVSAANHQYVNDPFGGPTRVNPLSPDDTDDEGYLRMIPSSNGVITKGTPIFNFDVTAPRKNSLNSAENGTELIPMLNVGNENQRLNSVSDQGESNPTSPKSPDIVSNINSFSNPSYQPMIKLSKSIKGENPEDVSSDNYVKMSQKDSGFIDCIDVNVPPSYSNPSYVTMTGNNKNGISPIYNNLPSATVM